MFRCSPFDFSSQLSHCCGPQRKFSPAFWGSPGQAKVPRRTSAWICWLPKAGWIHLFSTCKRVGQLCIWLSHTHIITTEITCLIICLCCWLIRCHQISTAVALKSYLHSCMFKYFAKTWVWYQRFSSVLGDKHQQESHILTHGLFFMSNYVECLSRVQPELWLSRYLYSWHLDCDVQSP